MQKRSEPFVTIVFLGAGGTAPRDMKRLFRTWSDDFQKGSLKVVSLSAALAAVGSV
jgi:hypothetical protein